MEGKNMIIIDSLARENIKAMQPYEMPTSARSECKLNQNESPYDIPNALKERILERVAATPWNRYNEGSSMRLRELLAAKFSLTPGNIIVGAGIDELLYYIALAFVEKGDKIVRFSPSFSMYKICSQLAEALDIDIRPNLDFSLPEKFIEESRYAKLTFICRPNNPTGSTIEIKTLENIVQNTRGLVCIDEAYADFADDNCRGLLNYSNVILLRTFSKAFSAAGIRIGYALANERVVTLLNRVKLPWNVSLFSQIAAEEIIQNSKQFEEIATGIKSERARLFSELQRLGVTGYPSKGNFILFRLPNATLVFESLLNQGILIRSFSSQVLKNCLRVTIGTIEQNDRFLQALERCLK
jgi:histidinol-phosphate aminotransferase